MSLCKSISSVSISSVWGPSVWGRGCRPTCPFGLALAALSAVLGGDAGSQDAAAVPADRTGPPAFEIERTVAHRGFDGETCWVHARAGAIPPEAFREPPERPLVVMTMQKLLLSGSDVFYPLHESHTDDLGAEWSDPVEQPAFARQVVSADADAALPTGGTIAAELLRPGDETTVCDFTPQWHAASGRLLGLGHTVWYRDNHVMRVRPRGIAYSVYDADARRWGAWSTVDLPDEPKFRNAGSGSVQRVDLPGGDVLVPIYFKRPEDPQFSVTVVRCRFDGRRLVYVGHGDELTVDVKRGLYEPSLTRFGGRYYLTMRNDDHGYVSVSEDGMSFDEPRRWAFDDGGDLGNYNTQQHWVTHSDGLFLVYTRRGADNDHVFRHRAPLFIARVDPAKVSVIRETEQVLVPERGARLGNFGVVDVSESETWVTAAEWMQPRGVETFGSDNSLHVVKLRWDRPNRRLSRLSWGDPAASRGPIIPEAVSPEESSSGAGLAHPDLVAHPDLAADPGEIIRGYATPPRGFGEPTAEYRSPLVADDGEPVTSAEQWSWRREQIRQQWQRRLGPWPELDPEVRLEVLGSTESEGITRHRVRFPWTPTETTEGYLLVPEGKGRRPAVISVYYEPESAIGEGVPQRDYAIRLARLGFVTLSLGTTEATAAKTYGLYYPSLDDAQVQPLSMLGYAAASAWHALANRDEVDADRIGIVGHSFGGKWAMFASCLFDRFACAVWSDPGIVFDESRPSVNYWEPWYLGYHPRPWRKRGVIREDNPARGLYPKLRAEGRDLHELHALMAPRPFLVSGGSEDPLERWHALAHTVAVNRLLGHRERVFMTNRPDHGPGDDANAVIDAFFLHFLHP